MAVVCSHCIAQTRRNAVMPPPSCQAPSVNKALTNGLTTEKHARPDYAAASWGATVVDHSEPLLMKGRYQSSTKLMNEVCKSWQGSEPSQTQTQFRHWLSPSFGEPGRCFALKGSRGFVVVKLMEPIMPDAITIEHVLGSVVDDAPKDCRVTAWMQHGMYEPYRNEFVLAEFSYDVGKRNLRGKINVRTFGVSKSVVAADDEAVANMVKLEFGSNHGRLNSTCIYRLRVHGHKPRLYSPLIKEA
uniref:SUN domain-containing protein 3-like n=1 Tax=Fragaria vesca subsp. vesca TaxID=101020 RepID=UPI0005C9B225|nr:PREDICTED: SUN domain-containing protein 3-like [Fragaria vesca subsp. vesca]